MMAAVERLDSLQLHQNSIFDDEVRTKIRNEVASKKHRQTHLPSNPQSILLQGRFHRRLVHTLQKSRSELVINSIISLQNTVTNLAMLPLKPAFIRVHPCKSV